MTDTLEQRARGLLAAEFPLEDGFTAVLVRDMSIPQLGVVDTAIALRAIVAALQAQQPAPAPVQVGDALGRFGHHPDPATDFEVEVTSLQGRLFNAKHAIPDKHGVTESVAQVADAIKRAMTFRVGGVETSVRAKSILHALEQEAAHPPAPAADGAGELPPLPEPTCLGFRNPCGITQLPDMGIYGYTSDQMRAYARAALAAQQESRNG